MAIEILENTLLKLLVRRGTNFDRQQIVLETGELGYTTDTKRLYVGDGVVKGGVVTGNKWAGSAAILTNLAPAVSGDYAYDTDNRCFKVLTKGTGSAANDWTTVSNLISAKDTTIVIDTQNRITVGKLSAGDIDYNALGSSLTLDPSNKVSLSSAISIDTVYQRDTGVTSYLSLPAKLKINAVDYTFPTTEPQPGTFLGYSTTDAALNPQLAWQVPKIVYSAVAPTTAALIPVGTITPYAGPISAAPYGWLNCNGQAVDATTYSDLLTAIGGQYGRNFINNTFNVPNLSSTFIHGFAPGTGAAESLGYQFPARGAGLSAQKTTLSAVGMNFIIKAFNGVTNPTLTVGGNLSATMRSPSDQVVDKTEISFNPLSGEITIRRATPGIKRYTAAGNHNFTMPNGISFVKFYVTGSGSVGDYRSGSAGSTAIGYLSAKPGTVFPIEVAAAPVWAASPGGKTSYIREPAAEGTSALVTAPGGPFGNPSTPATPTVAESNYLPTETILIQGGTGGIDTDDGGDEEDNGGAGYWGHAPAPGGGGGSHKNNPMAGFPSAGIVVFEWN